jgi:hypothetical protein
MFSPFPVTPYAPAEGEWRQAGVAPVVFDSHEAVEE